MRSLALVSFALLIMTGAALAADAAPAAVPGLVEIVAGGIATAAVAAVAFVAQKLFGVTIDARHRETLHSALRSAAALALSIGAEWISKGSPPAEARRMAEQRALDYVHQAAGDALSHFKLTEDDAMLRAMLQAATAHLVPPVAPALTAAN